MKKVLKSNHYFNLYHTRIILGFCCGVIKISNLLERGAVSMGNLLLTFSNSVSVPSSRVKIPKKNAAKKWMCD
jgi:hypothetical protein